MFVVSGNYNLGNALLELTQAYYRGCGTGPLLSSTKKAEQAIANQDFGWRKAMCEAIAEMLTVERAKKFPLLDRHEKVTGGSVDSVFRGASTEITWAGQVPDGDIASQIVDRVLALIDGLDGLYAEGYEEFRRREIRKGELQAGPEDREWIEAEAEKKRREVDEILGLLKPLGEGDDK